MAQAMTRNQEPGHLPVMPAEAIAGMALLPGGIWIDATFGGGGHTARILEATAPDGVVLAIDADPAAAERAKFLAAGLNDPQRLQFAHANFAQIADVARFRGFDSVRGVLFDFGLSSFQLDQAERGFAFRMDGPLDMRMDTSRGQTAADYLAAIDETELIRVLRDYGEEHRARRIAAAIIASRDATPIETTTQFANLVEQAVGGRKGARTHPATQTFQAIRIAINDELTAIADGMRGAIDILAPGGRLVTIAFHSLEDRLAKSIIAAESTTCICPPEQPVCTCHTTPRLRRVGGSKKPGAAEITRNPRARSAILRVAERLPDEHREAK